MDSQLHVVHVQRDGVIILTPSGEFDLASVNALRETFVAALAQGNRLVVDLSQAQFLDSTALGVIVAGGKRAQERDGWVRLVAPLPNVRHVLEITGIDTALGVYDTVEQATTTGEDFATPEAPNAPDAISL